MNIDLKKTIEGLKEINELIIEIKHGKQVQKVTKKSGEEENDKDETNYFEFQSINKDKNIEFILQTKNKSGDVINIGSREYTLEGINTQKKYYFLIDIPEAFKEGEQNNKMGEIIIAEIKMDFRLFSSNYKNNEFQTRKEEPELKKASIKIGLEEEYEKNNQNTVEEKMENSEFEKKLNKESLTKKNKIENDFNDREILRFSKACDYFVEFNNVKYETKISKGFELIFNNNLKVEPHRNIPTSNKNKKIQLNEEQKETVKNEQEENNKENEKLSPENSNDKIGENENELVEKKENMEVRMDEKQNNDILYSGNQKINIKEHNNLYVKNLNSEYTQKLYINSGSMENSSYVNNKEDIINKNTF